MVSPQQFSSYLRKPYDLDVTAEANLRSILQKYPYFSNAHLLLARSLRNQKSPAFDDALKQAAMFAGERSLLYKLVNIEEKEASPIEKHFDAAPAAIVSTPVEEHQPEAEIKETPLSANTYQETPQTATPEPQIEAVEEIAVPELEEEIEVTEHTDIEEFELPLAVEEPLAISLNEEAAPVENTVEEVENTYTPPTESTPDLNEEDKVKSAYEEIFGNTDTKEEDITTDFESFNDDDFVLNIDDNDSTDLLDDEKNNTAETLINEVKLKEHSPFSLTSDSSYLSPLQTTEEDFEAEIGDRLDNDGDGIIAPANTDSTPEEEFELDVVEAITNAQAEQGKTEETTEYKADDILNETEHSSDNEFEIGESENNDNIIIPVPDDDNDDEDFELDLDAIDNVESEQDEEIVKLMEQSIDEAEEKPAFETFEESTLEEPIAFKLEPKPATEEIRETPAKEEIAEAELTAETQEKTPKEGESVLLNHDTFFEWLSQLQNLQAKNTHSEKKNESTKPTKTVEKAAPIVTKVAETETQTPPTPAEATPHKKNTVDEIINRFISINPTISRPKAEFYNPTVKSKESDTERDDLATETLAKIYSDQQLNEKAIDVYQRLIKRFPHKTEQYKAAIAELEGSN